MFYIFLYFLLSQEKEIKEKYTDSDYTSTTEYTKIDKKKKKLGLEKKKVKTVSFSGRDHSSCKF